MSLKIFAIVMAVALTQTGANIMTSLILARVPSPLSLTWFSLTMNALLIFPGLVRKRAPEGAQRLNADDELVVEVAEVPMPPPTPLQLALFYALYVIANATHTIAVSRLGVALPMALFAAAPAFVAVLSMVWLRRPRYVAEICAAALSCGGMTLLAHPWTQHQQPNGGLPALAITCGLLSPVAAAVYKVLYARFYSGATEEFVRILLTKLAAINVVIGLPLVCGAVALGAEPSPLSPLFSQGNESAVTWAMIAGGVSLGIAFNFLVNYAVTITFPLLVSTATIVSASLGAIYSCARTSQLPDVWLLSGGTVITAAFCGLLAHDRYLLRKIVA